MNMEHRAIVAEKVMMFTILFPLGVLKTINVRIPLDPITDIARIKGMIASP